MTSPPERHPDEGLSGAAARLEALVQGEVTAGRTEPFVLLATVDPDGLPRHCALSRTELDAVGGHLHAALHARRTTANLERTGSAVLVAVDRDEIVSFRLRVQQLVRHSGLAGIRFDVVGMEVDSLGIELSPPTFFAAPELADSEHWDATRALLAELRAGSAAGDVGRDR